MRKLILILTVLCLLACNKDADSGLEKKTMFTIPYGALDDELTPLAASKLAMNDGFFYIIDSSLAKLMKFNSYGDLLTLYYNEDSQTARLLENSNRPDKSIHHEISYPFD